MPHFPPPPVPRNPLPDPVEILRSAFDGLCRPFGALERLFDWLEAAR